jgi:hypothetical protein
MNLISALEALLKARNELSPADVDDLVDLDDAIDNLCKVLGLSRYYLEKGNY